MRVRVLGSAAGGGFPQWNCNCRNCDGVRKGTLRATARTQSSIAVSGDGVNWVLFNASPDLLAQYQAFPGAAAWSRHARHCNPLDRADGRADRPHHRAADAARRKAAGNLLHRHGPRGPDHRQSPVQHSRPLLRGKLAPRARPTLASDLPSSARKICRSPPCRSKSKAPPYSPHRDNPHEGDNIGMRIDGPRRAARYSVLCAGPGRDRTASQAIPRRRRIA